jgi:hypothetical protein
MAKKERSKFEDIYNKVKKAVDESKSVKAKKRK